MSARSGGPPSGDDPPPRPQKLHRRIDGSYTGRTLPTYMDPRNERGELMVLRLEGVNGASLPAAPFLIKKSVHQFLGANIDSAFPEGGGRSYALKVRNPGHFEKLLTMAKLNNGTPVKVIPHPVHNTVKCIVYCRDVIDLPEEELLEELKEQNVIQIHRITRNAGQQRENTPLLVVTLSGTSRPEHIFFGFLRCPTRPYYPSPMQCFNCWDFGHTKTRCKASKATCGNCSGFHPIAEDKRCDLSPFCSKCSSGQHPRKSRACPAYRLENDVQRIKVDRDCTYPEARRILQLEKSGEPTYAEVANAGQTSRRNSARRVPEESSQQGGPIQPTMATLLAALAEKDERIRKLEAMMEESLRRNAELQDKLDKIINSQLLQTAATPQSIGIDEIDLMDDTLTSVEKPEGPSPALNSSSTEVEPTPQTLSKADSQDTSRISPDLVFLSPLPIKERVNSGDVTPKRSATAERSAHSTPTSVTKARVSPQTSGPRIAGKRNIASTSPDPTTEPKSIPKTQRLNAKNSGSTAK
ncbi:uncharacterized protein LOC134218372 [Armigeres subalbatus]|uniref:uncharacterized protein LOC134218372 n=1 Tax=Armigeres subalbatus TaxID=124917 RepID=UPI002ED20F94